LDPDQKHNLDALNEWDKKGFFALLDLKTAYVQKRIPEGCS